MVLTGGAGQKVGSHRAVKADEPTELAEAAPVSAAISAPDEPDKPSWIGRWIRNDPVRAVAAALIVIQLIWRLDISGRGYLSQDDFVLAARALDLGLTPELLLADFANHLAPGVMFITWVLAKTTGVEYWPHLVLLMAGQVAVSVALYRLLRMLLRPGWGLLIPLSVFLFSPLTLEVTSYSFTGLLILPMQLAMVLAVGAQVKYARTRRKRHLITLALSVIFGLAFFEKSLLIIPLVFLVTACFFVKGGPIRSVGRALKQYWQPWLVLVVIACAHVTAYLTRPGPDCNVIVCSTTLRQPASWTEVVTFVQQMIGQTFIPGLLGGPWTWTYIGDGAPLMSPPEMVRWLSWAAFAILVVITAVLRPPSVRAWALLAAYLGIVVGLFAATRLGTPLTAWTGLVARYMSDVVVVAAISIGVALVGLADEPRSAKAVSRRWQASLREPGAALVGLILVIAVVGVGTVMSGARYGDGWAKKDGRDYLRTAQADLAKAPPETVFLEGSVPFAVVPSFSFPYNLHSQFFRSVRPKPVFVTEAEHPSTFDDEGHVRLAQVNGVGNKRGPVNALDCGYQVTGGSTVRIPLDIELFDWPWMVKVGYFSDGDSPAALRLGNGRYEFQVRRGLHQIFFPLAGGGDAVELTLRNPAVKLCTNDIDVGQLAPQQ